MTTLPDLQLPIDRIVSERDAALEAFEDAIAGLTDAYEA